jgi:hypothetical protein
MSGMWCRLGNIASPLEIDERRKMRTASHELDFIRSVDNMTMAG